MKKLLLEGNNHHIEYAISGEQHDDCILFVHGLGANLNQFEQQHAYFNKTYCVLSINLPGHGRSTGFEKPKNSYEVLNFMSECVIELLDALNIVRVDYVGNSMGGNVGYELLKFHPQRLKSFTTFGTTAQLQTSNRTVGFLLKVHKLMSPAWRAYLSKFAGQTKISTNKINEMVRSTKGSTIIALLPTLANFNYLEVIKASTVPCLIIRGEKDRDINKHLTTTIQAFENRVQFELFDMKGVGHFANLDNPDLFNSVLHAFVLRHS